MADKRKKKKLPGSFKAPAKKAAFVIGILGFLLSLACLVGTILYRHQVDGDSEYVLEPIFILVSILPIVAYWKSNHRWYLPYLVVNVLLIIFKAAYIATAIIILEKPSKKQQHRLHKRRIVPIVCVTVLTLIFNVVAQCVVFRAYKYAKNENAYPKVFGNPSVRETRRVTQA